MKNLYFIWFHYILELQKNHYHENTQYNLQKWSTNNKPCIFSEGESKLVLNHISSIAFYSESLARKPSFFNAASLVNVVWFLGGGLCHCCCLYISWCSSIAINGLFRAYMQSLVHVHKQSHRFEYTTTFLVLFLLILHLVWVRILQHWKALLDPLYFPLSSGLLCTVLFYFICRW